MSTLEMTDYAVPQRTREQRAAALRRANEIRTLRARLKDRIRAGEQPVVPLLIDPPDYLATCKVFDLLLTVPKLGKTKVNRIFVAERISPSKTLGGLSERQRRSLVGALPETMKARTR